MEISKKLVSTYTAERHTLKVIEECFELGEVLTKSLTKPDGMKPPIEKVIEEMGDLHFRMNVLAKKLGIENGVQTRIEHKTTQMNEWVEKNEVNGSIKK